MHRERTYCSRYLRPFINLDCISVSIKIYDNAYDLLWGEISYLLQDQGYPNEPTDGIYELCSELQNWRGKVKLQGRALALAITRSMTEGA